MKISEVFTAGGIPSITYNSREGYKLETKLLLALENKGKILSITGSTKIGKSTLCKKVIQKEKLILVSCGTLANIDDFWSTINTKLAVASAKSIEKGIERSEGNSNELSVKAEAGFLGWLKATVEGKQVKSSSNTKDTRTIEEFRPRPLDLAITTLIEFESVLLIDDFHYCTKELQTEIIRSLKEPLSEGLKIILCLVPHREEDAFKVEREIEGRVTQFRIHNWSMNELEEIANKGFRALNVSIKDSIIKSFINESYNSPHLMQEFCYNYCYENNIFEKQDFVVSINSDMNLDDFYTRLVENLSSKSTYDNLVAGPNRDRKMRQFKNGSEGDIYVATMLALSKLTHFEMITVDMVREELKDILESASMPQKQQIHQVLIKMSEIAKLSTEREPVIDFQDNNFFIVDPFFSFYLKWCEK